ncbi:hypothetical protein [Streptomyces profundus]|uniref:hypothetical protein n=1 Tax=Streptomyces profundus TaxID=2867410 RepID=UPI001D16008A|nr:hypothetical protein [Streptomyces sp. MA3_2.13]UED84497.1 hypothetical protein K4G22_10015 [Streptomyces sp. MA3_2.13]
MTRIRATRLALAGLLAATTAVGCGIRPTDVPVDAGPAPTRASCDAPAGEADHAEIYLVCAQRLTSVTRYLPSTMTGGLNRTEVAGALLREMQNEPARAERTAGFSSAVPDDLEIASPAAEDPEGVVRLSERPKELPALALDQIICTFAKSELGNGQTVTLGGPPGPHSEKPQTYSCAAAKRSQESAHEIG